MVAVPSGVPPAAAAEVPACEDDGPVVEELDKGELPGGGVDADGAADELPGAGMGTDGAADKGVLAPIEPVTSSGAALGATADASDRACGNG